jgi:hypothetical protein
MVSLLAAFSERSGSPTLAERAPSRDAILHRREELHPDLLPYVYESDVLGQVLKAPLVFIVPYLPPLSALANEMYHRKCDALGRAEAEGDWSKVVWLHERPYRLPAFLVLDGRLSDRDYWELLGSIWLDTENLYEDRATWLQALTATRSGRARWLMDEEERATLASLGSEITIYRGYSHPGGHLAPSWSLSRSKAEWFATRMVGFRPDADYGYLATATVSRNDVLAYIGGRGEREIIVDPAILPDLHGTRVQAPERKARGTFG